jgi:small subunit ribosomal protein S20
MPQIKSAIKRVRQNEKKRQHNKARRSHMRSLVKKVFNSDDSEKAKEFKKEAESYLDRMTGKGHIHRNKAARKNSQMDRHIKNLADEES